jgi:hypothetical protein
MTKKDNLFYVVERLGYAWRSQAYGQPRYHLNTGPMASKFWEIFFVLNQGCCSNYNGNPAILKLLQTGVAAAELGNPTPAI